MAVQESNPQQLVRSKNQSEHKSSSGIRFSYICEGSQIYTSVWQRTTKIDDNSELCTSTCEPGIWSWWPLVYFSLVTAPCLWSEVFLAIRGGCWLYFSLFNNCHEFWAAFRPSRIAVEFLFVTVALCSELLFGRLESWLSYFSNVPDLSCKDCSGGYWFICRFLAKVQMIIFLRSELKGCWTCRLMGYPVRKMRISCDCQKIAPTVPMVIRRSNMAQLFQPKI